MSKKVKGISPTLKLREELREKEEQFDQKDDIFGMTLLTNPGYISSSRNIMFTSHLKQFVNLVNPDFPRVFTNYENLVGQNSTGYKQVKNDLEVFEIVSRFNDTHLERHAYLMFTYDRENDKYDVVEKRNVEDLTEKFGYSYNTAEMDKYDKGDEINKGTVLYKSTSYDENMNYRYGKNAKFIYMLEPNTIEDAIIVREGYAKETISKEIETVKVSLNDNDIFCNIYGDNETYKGFPDIGEYVNSKIVCAKRRIHNSQLLFDLKKTNLRQINFSSDTPFFCEGKVVDVFVYCNKTPEELEPNAFNKQILFYHDKQQEFFRKVKEVCEIIIDSGSKRSKDINYWYKRACDAIDSEYKWKDQDGSVFSNMVIEFVIERDIPLSEGQKITGRYGNKGVISKILPDDEMPVLENGDPVDIIFNSLGVVNRLNSQQLFEQSITFICNRVKERLATLKTMEEKEKLICRTVWYFNEKQEKKLVEYLNKLSDIQKEMFFDDIQENGIFVHIPPLWEKEPLFDRISKLYDEFDWIKPYEVFVNRFGRRVKILKDLIVGDMYIIKLKQTSKKNHSVRATGSLSKEGVPEKSNKAKTHQELYSKTPIRIGDQENTNSVIGVPPELVAKLHLFYRSSPIGRRELGTQLATSTKELKDFNYNDNFSNRNVEILQAYLKALGLQLQFGDELMNVDIRTGAWAEHNVRDGVFIGTQSEYEEVKMRDNAISHFESKEIFVGTNEEYDQLIDWKVNEQRLRTSDTGLVIDINLD